MTEYVVGFAFCDEFMHHMPTFKDRHVLLIRKNKPTWQVGLLNGLGGHVEDGESPAAAMRREFREEAGHDFTAWENFATMSGPSFRITFFRLWLDFETAFQVPGTFETNEGKVKWYPTRLLHEQETIPNVQFLVPLAGYRHDKYVMPHFQECP
jgi:8-oxo-dGTP pyrophosphatase MutT (NUDIX family)